MQNSRLIKKVFAALALVAVLFSFTACQNRDPSSSSEPSSSSSVPSSSSSKPAVKKPVPPSKEILDKMAEGEKINTDVIGYLSIPNTPAEGLVLQNVKDNFYYERKNITKAYDFYGCYYADAGNTFGTRDKLTKNTIIYAHNMSDRPDTTTVKDQKFSQLFRYKDVEWAKANPYITFVTPEDNMIWEVFAVYYTSTDFPSTKYNYNAEKPDAAQFDNIVKEAKLRSEMIYDVDVTKDDKILTLSTCTYKYGGENNHEQRFVLQAKLVPTGEDTKTVASVKKNPNPKPPTFSAEVKKAFNLK